MRFEEAYGGWQGGRLMQEEAARLRATALRRFPAHKKADNSFATEPDISICC
jgi:hypothetical protein